MSDPYLYPGTDVLRNRLDLRTREDLEFAETTLVALAFERLKLKPLRLPIGWRG